jgi:hypothetical protein
MPVELSVDTQEKAIIAEISDYRKACVAIKDWDEHLRCHCAHRWVLRDRDTKALILVQAYGGTDSYHVGEYVSDIIMSTQYTAIETGEPVMSNHGRMVFAEKVSRYR